MDGGHCRAPFSVLPYAFPAGSNGPMVDPQIIVRALLRNGIYSFTDPEFSCTRLHVKVIAHGTSSHGDHR
jgi:hypothetical protein